MLNEYYCRKYNTLAKEEDASIFQVYIMIAPFVFSIADLTHNEVNDSTSCTNQRHQHQEPETENHILQTNKQDGFRWV